MRWVGNRFPFKDEASSWEEVFAAVTTDFRAATWGCDRVLAWGQGSLSFF